MDDSLMSAADTNCKPLEQVPIRDLRGARIVRALNHVFRLNRKWHPLLSLFNSKSDLVRVPFGGFELIHPAAWRKELTAYLLTGENTVPEFKLMRELCVGLAPGKLVDVGANMGLYVLLARSAAENPIVAFEPVPFLFDLLRRNVLHNQLEKVDVRRQACGSELGEICLAAHMNAAIIPSSQKTATPEIYGTFNDDANAARSGDRLATAPLITLDDAIGSETVSLIKIDCEGYELQVLSGAKKILERDRPRLFIEVHPALIGNYDGSVERLLDFLSSQYEMEFWDFDQARHVSKLLRSWRKHRPNSGKNFPGREAFIAACKTFPLPAQLYIVARPRA